MKKVLIGVSTVVALGVGGVLVAGQMQEEPKESLTKSAETTEGSAEVETKSEQVSKTEDSKTDSESVNTETNFEPKVVQRFEELPNEMRPWGKWDYYQVEQFQAEGKIVYLFEDAEELEKSVFNALNARKIPENKKNMKILDLELERMNNHLNGFVKDVKSQIDNQSYIAKLEETDAAVKAGDYDLALNLINEATQIREPK